MSEHTYTQAVADLFRSRPGEWLDGLEIARAGGAYAWRSRVSDVRTQLGMVIENRQRKVGKRTVSEYRFQRLYTADLTWPDWQTEFLLDTHDVLP